MKINKKLIIILLIGLFVFYIIPHFAVDMQVEYANNYASICILFINSLYIILTSILLTKYNIFKWYYVILIILLFALSVILYFNIATIVYSLLYIAEYLISRSIYLKCINR